MAKFRSKFEASVAKQLKSKKVKYKYETGKLDYTSTYTPDFQLPNGIYIECKGYHRNLSQALAKLRKVQRDNPDVDLRIVWQNASMKISKTLTAGQWSTKHGFKWAEGFVPIEWTME